MKDIRKKRLQGIAYLLLGSVITVSLVLYAMRENTNFYFSPSKIANGEAQLNRTLRVGGLVVAGSTIRSKTDLNVAFALTDGAALVTVKYDGILPDLFREGQGIVAEGKLNEQGEVIASKVLAKHDENYMPPQISKDLETVKKQGENSPYKNTGSY